MLLSYFLGGIYKVFKNSYEKVSIQRRYNAEGTDIDPSAQLYMDTDFLIYNKKISKITIGKKSYVHGHLQTYGHGGKITIGDYTFIGPNTRIWSGKSIRIGSRVEISHNCNIIDNDTHPLDSQERFQQFLEIIEKGMPEEIALNDKEIIIEDDVWIAANVIILKGVTIGKGAIVGAGSVVTHDIPEFAIAHGNPAKVYGYVKE